ncbi:hypothetical protein ABW16_00260 [Mycolicibacter heraklionensis]|uniref:DUF732 domain-containing protein n=1 Tax=Mycolicibacter heraklionensis TaxID=512402 RepID=A0ABR5FK24_9MYCO|nr:DUF732 domain-containing protein [Mycolicibacter heraklionensis]KLO31347.1 hypothetical protein ABW16_00260 [Mycolicibacter heraklionensis]
MRIRAALLGALGCICLAAPAHADPSETDTAFLVSLRAAGITYTNADQAIITAKLVCGLIAEGKPSPEVLEGLKARNPGLTTEHGTQFVGIAAQSYCPDQLVRNGT